MSDSSSMTFEQRREAGRAMRLDTPRISLADLVDRPTHYDPIGELIAQGEDRVQSLLPIRYARMLESPFAFYRGAALLMADDLSRGTSTTLDVQICGDAHLSNFGVFSSPERQLVFDVNDFDETEIGPFEWDVKRLVTSLAIASQQLGHRASQQENIAAAAAHEYRTAMADFSLMSRLEVWYATLDLASAMKELRGFFSSPERVRIDDIFRRVKSKGPESAFARVVVYENDIPKFVNRPPHFMALSSNGDSHLGREDVDKIVTNYVTTLSSDRQALLRQFEIRDVARHVVGVGSVGTECLAVLLVGRTEHDLLLLQIKEAQTSVVTRARGLTSTFEPGDRVVRGQRMMQATPDVLLGWHTLEHKVPRRSFYVRQLYDNKASIDFSALDEPLLIAYARVCAWTLARAHARSGRSAEIAGYLGKNRRFDEAMASFALQYQKRNESDYHAMRDAVQQGRLRVHA